MSEEGFDIVKNTDQTNDTTPLLKENAESNTRTNKDLYDLYHGSSTRIPGGNCVFESVLAYMSDKQIQNMIYRVEDFIAFLQQQNDQRYENMFNDIQSIFANTPNSKYADLCAYMRAYVYLICQIKKEKLLQDTSQARTTSIDNSITQLINGEYITPDPHILSASRRLTEHNILKIYVDSGRESSSAILKNECETADTHKHKSSLLSFDEIKAEVEKLDQTGMTNSETIYLFLKGAHCTPAVPKAQKGQGAQIDCKKFKMQLHVVKSPVLKFTLSIVGLLGGGIGGFFFPPLWWLCIPSAIGLLSSCKDVIESQQQNDEAFKELKTSSQPQISENSESQQNGKTYDDRPLKQKLKECEDKAKKQSNSPDQPNQTPEIYT